MTCEHDGCFMEIFNSCTNHCDRSLCLEHLIEHGDQFVDEFSNLIDQVEKTTMNLIEEIQLTKIEVK